MRQRRRKAIINNTTRWTFLHSVFLFLSAGAGQTSNNQTSLPTEFEMNVSLQSTHRPDPMTTGFISTTTNIMNGVTNYSHDLTTVEQGDSSDGVKLNLGYVNARDDVTNEATTGVTDQQEVTGISHLGRVNSDTTDSIEDPFQASHFNKETAVTTTLWDTTKVPDPADESRTANTAMNATTFRSLSSEDATVSSTNTPSLVSTISYEWQIIHPGYVTDCEIARRAIPNGDGKYVIRMTKMPHNKTSTGTSLNASICSVKKFVGSEFSVYAFFGSALWGPLSRCKIAIKLCYFQKKCTAVNIVPDLQSWNSQYYILSGRKEIIELTAQQCLFYSVEINYRVVPETLLDTLPVLNSTSPNSGYVISPGFDDNKHYPNGVNMTLSINVASDEVILLSYIHFHLEESKPVCRFDWLELTCVNTTEDHPVWKKCGRQDIPPQVFHHSIQLRFISDGSVHMSGFKILYTILPRSQEPGLLSADDEPPLFNCSVPHFAQFAHHFNCNLAVDCFGAEDETQCPYSSPDCGPGFIEAGDKCYQYSNVIANISWSNASSYCRTHNQTLVDPSDPEQWERFKDLMVGYGRLTSTVFTGLRTSQNRVAEVPSLYRDMWQWSDSTMALYANISYTKFSMPLCTSFQAEVNPYQLTPIGCLYALDGRIICEKPKTELSSFMSTLLPSLPQINNSWSDGNVSFPMVPVTSCSSGHLMRDFLACDQQSFCQNKHHGVVCDTKGVSLFACLHGTQSVHYTLTCDFRIDCPDGSDEDFCKHPVCKEDKCRSGECIAKSENCDGMQHCKDGSDENCPQVLKFVSPVPPPALVRFDGRGGFSLKTVQDSCPDTHFWCVSSNYCLPLYVRCNNVYDCPDQEDEMGCDTFQCPGFFRCRGSTVCLHPTHLCDGVFQCPQHDDELLCGMLCPEGCQCQGLAFVCRQRISPADFPSLRYLDASGSGMNMEALARNAYLIYLGLANCHIADILPMKLKNLRTLDLSYNFLTTLELDSLAYLDNLRSLFLVGNPVVTLVAFTPPASTHNGFRTISLSGTLLETINASVFSGFPHMKALNLSRSPKLSTITEDGFKALPHLVLVDLRDCPRLESYPTDLLQGLTLLNGVYADDYRLCCKAALPAAFNRDNCHAPADDIASCDDLLRSVIFRVFLWIFAFLAVLGNAGSFFTRFYIQNESFQSSFNVFVTNLSVADFLMGVYLTMIGVADQVYKGRYLWQGDTWKNNAACQTAGFLSLLSTEVSAFFICLITLDRFLVLRFPFSKVHFSKKSALVACGIAWFTGFILAVVPLLPMTSHWKFYSQTGICIPLPFFSGEDKFPGHSYSFGVMIVLNFVQFLLIAVGQIFIYMAVKSGSKVKRKSSRDVAIARRLTTIVLSDFLCWFPIGLLGLLAFTGTPIPTEVNVGVAIFVLPFNSALNPFLYTFNIVMEKRRKAVEARMLQRLETRHITEMSQLPGQLAVTKETALNQIEGWLGIRVITLSDLAARYDMAPRMHDVGPPPSVKAINDVL